METGRRPGSKARKTDDDLSLFVPYSIVDRMASDGDHGDKDRLLRDAIVSMLNTRHNMTNRDGLTAAANDPAITQPNTKSSWQAGQIPHENKPNLFDVHP